MIVTDDNFNEEVLKVKKPVFVEIAADWSGTSHIIAPVIENLAAKYKNQIKFVKLNINENNGITNKYGINEIPVLLIFKNGEVQDSIKGVFSSRDLENIICELLKNNQ